jgi:hypothetical protein
MDASKGHGVVVCGPSVVVVGSLLSHARIVVLDQIPQIWPEGGAPPLEGG